MNAMDSLGRDDLQVALEFVRACEMARDLAAYRAAVLQLRMLVPGHLVSYNEVDLVAEHLVSDLEPSDLRFEGDWEVFGRYAHQHPVIAHHEQTGDLGPRALSDFLSVDELHALDLYREFYRRMEVEDQIAIGLPSPPGIVIGVAISRRERGFSPRDRDLLALVAPHAGDAYRAARLRSLADDVLGGADGGGIRHAVVLTADGRAEWLSPAAAAVIRRHLGEGVARDGRLPEPLGRYAAGARARTASPEGLRTRPERMVREHDGTLLVVRLLRAVEPEQRDVLVLEERADPLARPRLRALGLTDRQAEVVRLVAEGLTNQEIAERLGLSQSTVKRHLEHLTEKLGVSTRAAVVARVLRG